MHTTVAFGMQWECFREESRLLFIVTLLSWMDFLLLCACFPFWIKINTNICLVRMHMATFAPLYLEQSLKYFFKVIRAWNLVTSCCCDKMLRKQLKGETVYARNNYSSRGIWPITDSKGMVAGARIRGLAGPIALPPARLHLLKLQHSQAALPAGNQGCPWGTFPIQNTKFQLLCFFILLLDSYSSMWI